MAMKRNLRISTTTFIALLVLAGCAGEGDAVEEPSEDDLTTSAEPGPSCKGATIDQHRIDTFLTSGEETTFSPYVVTGDSGTAVKLADARYSGWARNCKIDGGRRTCTAWTVASSSSTPAGVYLGQRGNNYAAGVYLAEPYSIFSDGTRWEGTAYVAAVSLSVPASRLGAFQTLPAHYHRTSNVAGQYDDRTTGPFTGAIRKNCAKFTRISRTDERVTPTITTYRDIAEVYNASY